MVGRNALGHQCTKIISAAIHWHREELTEVRERQHWCLDQRANVCIRQLVHHLPLTDSASCFFKSFLVFYCHELVKGCCNPWTIFRASRYLFSRCEKSSQSMNITGSSPYIFYIAYILSRTNEISLSKRLESKKKSALVKTYTCFVELFVQNCRSYPNYSLIDLMYDGKTLNRHRLYRSYK